MAVSLQFIILDPLDVFLQLHCSFLQSPVFWLRLISLFHQYIVSITPFCIITKLMFRIVERESLALYLFCFSFFHVYHSDIRYGRKP